MFVFFVPTHPSTVPRNPHVTRTRTRAFSPRKDWPGRWRMVGALVPRRAIPGMRRRNSVAHAVLQIEHVEDFSRTKRLPSNTAPTVVKRYLKILRLSELGCEDQNCNEALKLQKNSMHNRSGLLVGMSTVKTLQRFSLWMDMESYPKPPVPTPNHPCLAVAASVCRL